MTRSPAAPENSDEETALGVWWLVPYGELPDQAQAMTRFIPKGGSAVSRSGNVIRHVVTVPSRGARLVEFLFRRSDAAGDLYPEDPAEGTVPGPDRDRVLFLGERGTLSLGVRTHELTLPAFFARHRALSTKRGVAWTMAPIPSSRLQDAPDVVRGLGSALQQYDVVVVLTGITDSLRVLSPSRWEQHLRETLDALRNSLPKDARIVVGAIPPLENAGSLSKPARVAAGLHGRALNQRSKTVTRDYDGTLFIEFPEELTQSLWRPESEEHRYRNTYKVWGEHLSTQLN